MKYVVEYKHRVGSVWHQLGYVPAQDDAFVWVGRLVQVHDGCWEFRARRVK